MYDMADKEVINLHDGQRLGYITDAEIDINTGRVVSFLIEGRRRFFGFLGKEPDISIKWEEIEKIGVDMILIRKENAQISQPESRRFYY